MLKIHGGIWIGLALLIWFYTMFIESRVGDDIPFFRWVAFIFIAWGAFRLTQDHVFGKKKEQNTTGPPQMSASQHTHSIHGSPHQTHQHVRHPHGSPHQTHTHTRPHPHVSGHHAVVRCAHCHKSMPARVHFCPSCGAKR